MTISWGTSPSSSLTGAATSTVLSALLAVVALGPAPTPPAEPQQSCAAMLDSYVDRAMGLVGPTGWIHVLHPLAAATTRTAVPAEEPDQPVTGSDTGTNTQEAGVDEPDVAKSDGRVVVRLVEGRRMVLTDVTGASPHDVGSWSLPGGSTADGLLLVGDHVLLTSVGADTRLLDVDVSDPASPRLAATQHWSGRQLTLRQYGETVRLVISTDLPDLPFVAPGHGRSASRALQENRRVVRRSTLRDWAPDVPCSELHQPQKPDTGHGTVEVLTLDPTDLSVLDATGVVGSADGVYASADHLYTWSTEEGPALSFGPRLPGRPMVRPRTVVHAFALDGHGASYTSSGVVVGLAKDRWSFDEHDGLLRVAVSFPCWGVRCPTASSDNGIAVLAERGGRLSRVGLVRGIGRDEDVQAVRWYDDTAVLVTYRATDPLWTVDLSEPTRPRTLGELRLPGYSGYLHPIGAHRLLGVGSDGHDGAQATLFDVTRLAHPRELDAAAVAPRAFIRATDDPHAFTWLPASADTGTAVLQVDSGAALGSDLELVRVEGSGRIVVRRLPSPGGAEQRALPLPDGRIALVGTRVLAVDPG